MSRFLVDDQLKPRWLSIGSSARKFIDCLSHLGTEGGGSIRSAGLATDDDAVVAERGHHFEIGEPGFLKHRGQLPL